MVYVRSMKEASMFNKFKEMKRMLERDIVKRIMKYINEPDDSKGWKGYCWKNHGNMYSVKGLPDLMAVILKDGKSFFICLEVKQPGKDMTQIQKVLMKKFTKLNIVARKVTKLSEVKKIIQELE